MNKLQSNALRIAELMGWNIIHDDTAHSSQLLVKENIYTDYEETISDFSSYNGLMPIVFESKKSKKHTINILAVSVVFGGYVFFNEFETIYGKSFESDSEESFIEALQLAVIKYLELKQCGS